MPEEQFNDESRMPFGQHANSKMRDVPAQYLLYLWDNGLHEMHNQEGVRPGTYVHKQIQVAQYIYENFVALEKEARDYIVKYVPKPRK